MKKFLIILSFLLLSTPAAAWEVWSEQDPEGLRVSFAEAVGDTGAMLSLVCMDQNIHLEVAFPGSSESLSDAFITLQTDDNIPIRVAGFIESLVEEDSTVFFGLDRKDNPAPTTGSLVYDMFHSDHLYLLQAETSEPMEHWSMYGVVEAVTKLTKLCGGYDTQEQNI